MSNRRISVPHLRDLWSQYSEFRKPQLAPSTSKRDYTKIQRRLVRLQTEAPELNSAIAVRDWLLANYSPETARRTLVQLNACCKWAMYVADMAYLCRVSTTVLYKHYLDLTRSITVPEF